MALTFGFFLDPALTTPVTSPLQFVQSKTSPVAADKVVYFGSLNEARACHTAVSPGDNPITIGVTIAGAGNVYLATSAAGLDTATAGAALEIGNTVAGGIANAIAIHVRVLDVAHVVGRRAVTFSTVSISEHTE
jgi:hypothetical protein